MNHVEPESDLHSCHHDIKHLYTFKHESTLSKAPLNSHQSGVPGSTYDAFAVGGPGAALNEDLFIALCQHAAHVDRLPLVGRRHLKQLQTQRVEDVRLRPKAAGGSSFMFRK